MSESMPGGIQHSSETEGGSFEAAPLTDKQLIGSAIQHNLLNDAGTIWERIFSSKDQNEFANLIRDFNETPPEDRGKDRYEHSRPLTERIDRSMEMTIPSGYPFTVTLQKDGTLSLKSGLVQ